MSDVEILRFMKAIWPRAVDLDMARVDARAAIRAATELMIDQRSRLVRIDDYIHSHGMTPRELAEKIEETLRSEGPGSVAHKAPERKPIEVSQPVYYHITPAKKKEFGYGDMPRDWRLPARCVNIDRERERSVMIAFLVFPGTERERTQTLWVTPGHLDPRDESEAPTPSSLTLQREAAVLHLAYSQPKGVGPICGADSGAITDDPSAMSCARCRRVAWLVKKQARRHFMKDDGRTACGTMCEESALGQLRTDSGIPVDVSREETEITCTVCLRAMRAKPAVVHLAMADGAMLCQALGTGYTGQVTRDTCKVTCSRCLVRAQRVHLVSSVNGRTRCGVLYSCDGVEVHEIRIASRWSGATCFACRKQESPALAETNAASS